MVKCKDEFADGKIKQKQAKRKDLYLHLFLKGLDLRVRAFASSSECVEFVLESNQFLRVGLEAAVFSAQTLQLSSGLSVHLRQGR
jgi:hypothetical protein